MTCIPNDMEKYITFSFGQLRFIDSAKFMSASLDKLVAANQPEAFRITTQYEPNRGRKELLLRKDVCSYEYKDFWEPFAEPQLLQNEAFYSKLSDEDISNDDYAHAQKV